MRTGTLRLLLAVGFALGALAGCDCSTRPAATPDTGTGKRDAGGVVVLDDAGNVVAPPDAGEAGPADGGPEVVVGPGQFEEPGNVLDGLSQNDAGYLVLDKSEVRLHFAWLANPEGNGSVSKIDTTTGKEVARYVAAFPLDGKGKSNGLTWKMAHASSRTAVDLNGDVWLANRAFGITGSVTKIANAKADCVDRNGNGKIDTSADTNGNGLIDEGEWIKPADPANPKQYDECILFSTAIGTAGEPTVPRALAIDSGVEGEAGAVWVGLWCGMSGTPEYHPECLEQGDAKGGAFVKLSPSTGELLEIAGGKKHVNVPIKPYGAAVDSSNRVWMSHYNHTWTAAVVASTGQVLGPYQAPKDWGGYGVTVQVTKTGKTRVWIANIGRDAAISRFDVETSTWSQFDFASELGGELYGHGRGIAVDDSGTAWMSAYLDPSQPLITQCGSKDSEKYVVRLVGIDTETGHVKKFSNGKAVADLTGHFLAQGQPPPCNGIGVGMDNDNKVWVAAANGYATAVDRTTGEISRRSPDVGSLYTYSDFTGYTLRTFTAPQGSFKTTFQGCSASAKTHWKTLSWQANVPANTKLRFFVRAAATKADFNQPGTRYGPFETSPVDLEAAGVPSQPLLQVEVVFVSNDKTSSPSLKDLRASFACEEEVN